MNCTDIFDLIVDLQEKGFDQDFIFEGGYLRCLQNGELTGPDEFDIAGCYSCYLDKCLKRVVLYAVQLIHAPVKGIAMQSGPALTMEASSLLRKQPDDLPIQVKVQRDPLTERMESACLAELPDLAN